MATCVFYYTSQDVDYMPMMKLFFKGHQVHLNGNKPLTFIETMMFAKSKSAEYVITTSPYVLQKLLGTTGEKLPSLDDYAGSFVDRGGIKYLILNPLFHLVTSPHGQFIFKRYLSKITHPEAWFKQTEFSWELANETNITRFYAELDSAVFTAVDIETIEQDRVMDCVSYTSFFHDDTGWFSHSVLIPVTSEFFLSWIRKFNLHPVRKALQNGKYDSAYFFRFDAPVTNYVFDTINLFHSLFCELPKRLDFIAGYALREIQFWKDEGEGSLSNRYRYCCKDGWATGNAVLSLISEMPDYAIQNYRMEFPTVFPCHQGEMQGIAADVEELRKIRTEQEIKLAELTARLNVIMRVGPKQEFNPSSPIQLKRLISVLTGEKLTDIKDTEEKTLKKLMFKHPLNAVILDLCIQVRKAKKLIGTYLNEDKIKYEKRDLITGVTTGIKYRIMYTLNPHGTDTTRLASKEAQFSWSGDDWAGLQIQNTPRDKKDVKVKGFYISDEGFYLGEGDYEQAEARDVAYLSGDANLIQTVESGRDFHALNAERFFGLAYDTIYNDAEKKTINPEIRDLSKRTNHGANYNMGPAVLVDTMGLENIYRAAKILKLPVFWGPLKIAEHLLNSFEKAYPTVKGAYYDSIIYSIKTTRTLVSALGWTRYCFGNPEKNKQDLNRYVAHPSQNLNAGCLNRAWMSVFKNIALKEVKDFKLHAQIHDSILFSYRHGREDLVRKVYECMLFSIPVKDCKGTERILRVPVAMKGGARKWSELKSIDMGATHNG